MRRGAWCWLVICYAFAVLRTVHRASFPVWQAACFAWGLVIVIGYCLEANGIPLVRGLPHAHGWDIRRWPVANRRVFLRIVALGGLVTGILSLAGYWVGR